MPPTFTSERLSSPIAVEAIRLVSHGATDAAHQCDPDRLTDYRMFELRGQVADFEPQLRRFLTSPPGRFERWLAARDVAGPDALP